MNIGSGITIGQGITIASQNLLQLLVVGGGAPGAGNGGNGTVGGGGGGGGTYQSGYLAGASGGSGAVIIRYADTYASATNTTGSPTITVSGGYRVYKFTSSGSITF
jgi:hypothetical protein